MDYSFLCILSCLGIATGNIRQVLIPGGGGPVSSYYGQHCDVICDEETHAATSACATNGILYKSQCEYRNAQCKAIKSGDLLSIVSYGACVTLETPCDVVMQTKCIPHQISAITGTSDGFEAICGSNNRTYDSTCEFRAAQCQHEQMKYDPLTVAHTGECQIDPSNLVMVIYLFLFIFHFLI
ncbi:follistatin-related protein 3-like [Ruditapes philippinarum]|uniref:follistatin-related protein 3-like n=1 Tax=Ruditapes philippinarum TaxID=129788 RepID=UPI00295B5CA2|nr:follistatin-related protein 3-like [Ruditapes philippinarum]